MYREIIVGRGGHSVFYLRLQLYNNIWLPLVNNTMPAINTCTLDFMLTSCLPGHLSTVSNKPTEVI